MLSSECRFEMHEIHENEVRDENGYSIFEPALSFHVGATNLFGAIGKSEIPHVVIMHAREEWLKETLAMVRDVDEELPRTQYDYHLLGTEFSVFALRRDGLLDLHTGTGYGVLSSMEPVGRVSVRGWVEAVVDLSRRLSELFHRLQPGLFAESLFERQELTLQEIESWLIAHPA